MLNQEPITWLNIINLTYGLSNLVAWRKNALLSHVEGLGFHSCRLRFFFLFFIVVLLCFVSFFKKKTYRKRFAASIY